MPLYDTDSKEAKKLEKIIANLKKCVKADEHNRKEAIEDLKFLNGEQWAADEKRRRSIAGRPALQINLLPKFVDQVVGDGRHNRPKCKVRPASDDADMSIANIREGLIADIEYQSNSEAIYDQALEMAASCGYGAWRVLTRYCEDNPFQQEIYLEYIENPLQVYLDPAAKDPVGMDSKYGFVLDKMTKDEFEECYPDAQWTSEALKTGIGVSDQHFFEDELITVAEYYEVKEEEVEMHLLEDGRVVSDKDYKQLRKEWKAEQKRKEEQAAMQLMSSMIGGAPGLPMGGALPPPIPVVAPQPLGGMPGAPASPSPETDEPKIEKTKTAYVRKVKQYVLTAWEFLNENAEKGEDFAGKFVPLVQVRGKVRNIEGKRYVRGLIRDGKDSQKLLNYWETSGAETMALAPKAPWVGSPKMFEGHENEYANANVENFPFLMANADPDFPGMLPQRQGIPNPPVGMFTQAQRAQDNIKATIGMFNADVGAPDSRQTGAAVIAGQKPGDIATFVFQDNLAKAIRMTGVIVNEMLEEVYDTERDVRVRSEDGTELFVPVNTTLDKAIKKYGINSQRYRGLDMKRLMEEAQEHGGKYVKFNQLGSGRYDVVIKTGPSYATARQESQQLMMQLVQAMPQQASIALDLICKNLDFKDAEELSKRFEKALPPGMAPVREGEPPPQPPPPPPQVQLAQAKLEGEKVKGQLMQMKVQQETVKLEHEKLKVQLELAKAQAQNAPDSPEAPDPSVQIEMQMNMEKMQHERAKMQNEEEMRRLQVQNERIRLDTEIQKQELAMQQAREMHQARMAELQAQSIRDEMKAKREEKAKKDPLKLRKK